MPAKAAKKKRKKPKKPAGWVAHAQDDLSPAAIKEAAERRGVSLGRDVSREAKAATAKRLGKLGKILRLERAATGEDAW